MWERNGVLFLQETNTDPSFRGVSITCCNRKVFGNIDFLGAPREMRSEEQLRVISEEYEDISFVILSDVWLDQPKVNMVPPPQYIYLRGQRN